MRRSSLAALAALAISATDASDVRAQKADAPPGVSRAVAGSIPTSPDPRHVLVLDSAKLLNAAEIAALQDSAQRLQSENHADIAFVTLPSLHGGAVEDAALAIGRTWMIGSAGALGDPNRNRGIVRLYVSDKKSVAGGNLRVEVGRGLEGALTDGGGSRAIIDAIKPHFRAKRYGDGFIAPSTLPRGSFAPSVLHNSHPGRNRRPRGATIRKRSSGLPWWSHSSRYVWRS